MKNNFKYLAVEGNEGTGKTTLSKALAERLGAFWTYEPNAETEELKILREIALNKSKQVTSYTRELCKLANRSTHQNLSIIPKLNNNEMVITDRSFLSGMVYAKIETYDFKEWFELSNSAKISLFPEMIIYCTSTERKIVKRKLGREDDIYDTAPESIISKIDQLYEEALEFIQRYPLTKHIPIIRYRNDFSIPVKENLEKLMITIEDSSKLWV